MNGQYSTLDLSKTRIAVRRAAERARAGVWNFWIGWVLGLLMLLFVVFFSGSVFSKLGAPSELPLSVLVVCCLAALLLGLAAFRAVWVQRNIGRICEKKLRRSGLLEKLASGEMEDVANHYYWPWKQFAARHKQSFRDLFYRSVLYIDWHSKPPRPVFPKEYIPHEVLLLLALLIFGGTGIIMMIFPQIDVYPMGLLFQIYLAAAVAIAAIAGIGQAMDFPVLGQVAQIALERLEARE